MHAGQVSQPAKIGKDEIHQVIGRLRKYTGRLPTPAVTRVAAEEDLFRPYRVLISCLISLRTKDQVTDQASRKLFALAGSPAEMAQLPVEKVADAIYPAGFYNTKARTILEVSRDLLDRFDGQVPDDIEQLMSLKGVGRKTANLVVTMAFGLPGICVDTHVHRIANRWGYVRTRNPGETERALRRKLPLDYWIEINDLLVTFGQNHCTPISPHCSTCPLGKWCPRRGVARHR